MAKAPCCEITGLKKGPWTPEEDRILISYVQLYGHENWRALPKQAGLRRCGKSCRLRWKNYLRPDIKRGNFSKQEEETIIKLHQLLGNRWSAIAARLPGRTDNEIKNFWNSQLKKRLKQNPATPATIKQNVGTPVCTLNTSTSNHAYATLPPQQSQKVLGLQTNSTNDWSILARNVSATRDHYPLTSRGHPSLLSHDPTKETTMINSSSFMSDEMDFWYKLLVNSGTDDH